MKTNSVLGCLLFCTIGMASPGAIVETHTFNSLNLDIPDGSPSGLANVQNFATAITAITDVDVSFHVVGTPDADPRAFNGDIYAYLTHASGFTVLLSRAGRTTVSPFGYDDNGFNLTFDDAAPNGDVHLYRNVAPPVPGAPLTGLWRPDGRTTDPNLVLDTNPQSAFLSSLNGGSAAGDWTLFVADLSTGEQQRLSDWSLTITGVPEPATAALLGIGGLLIVRVRRRR
jgi:hypothetical protein